MDEIISFKKNLLQKTVNEAYSSHRGVGPVILTSLQDDFLKNTAFNNIAEVNEIAVVTNVIILGTIKCVHKNIEWFYLACKSCKKKATQKIVKNMKDDGSGDVEEKQIFECNNSECDETVVSPVPRFKIPLTEQDRTGIVSLTLFDHDAKKLLKKTADELIEKFLEGDDINLFLVEFNDLLERKIGI